MIVQEMGYEVPNVVKNSDKLLEVIDKESPDLLLLDIQLQGSKDGLAIAELLATHENPLPVIFVTALKDNDTFTKAKKTNPYGYITKPFEKEDVKRTIDLAMNNYANWQWEKANIPIWTTENVLQEAFFVKEDKEIVKVLKSDIMYLEVVDRFTKILTRNNSYMMRVALSNILTQLPTNIFLQVHRNFVINLNYIERIDTEYNEIIMQKHRIPISKRHKEALFNRLHLLG